MALPLHHRFVSIFKREGENSYSSCVSHQRSSLFRTGELAKKICVALRQQLNRQSWALEPGQVAAALFSDQVDNKTKSRMAAKILALRPNPDSTDMTVND